jgi:hypothetical protein
MKKLLSNFFLVILLASASLAQIQSSFFGMNQSHSIVCPNTPLSLQYPLYGVNAALRDWNLCTTQWADINSANGVYNFASLDGLLAGAKSKNVDVYITLGATPNWISSKPTDTACDRANSFGQPAGMCDPPSDINPDGTGTDTAWRAFITALVTHVSTSSYLQTHAHIMFYEIWSEFSRSDSIGTATCNATGPTCSYRGTFAQMLRMTQDLRCIVEGFPNDPITALNTTCGNDKTMPVRGLDPTARIAEGDAGDTPLDNGNIVMQNYLYCNNNPPVNSQCNYGSAGSAATDIIDGHPYFTSHVPEALIPVLADMISRLSLTDQAKLRFASEGSWGQNSTVNDPMLQAAYVPRWFAVLLIQKFDRGYWWSWDGAGAGGNGGLWNSVSMTFPPNQCNTIDPVVGGYDCTGGTAFRTTIQWFVGNTVTGITCPTSCSNPTLGVYTMTFTGVNGQTFVMVWDSSQTSPCSNPMCGQTPLPTLPFQAANWQDVLGNNYSGQPKTIGASPIWLVKGTGPLAPQNLGAIVN